MNFKKIRKKIKKLNFLLDSLEGEDAISLSEQDLLKSYLLETFKEVDKLELDGDERTELKAPVIDIPEIKPVTVRSSEPSVLDIEEEEMEMDMPDILEPVEAEDNAQRENGHGRSEPIRVSPAPNQQQSSQKETADQPSDLDELFDEIPVTELSDKLSMQPVKDLHKTMGINEKIFTVTELFGGDNDAYKHTINGLNGFHSFMEAKHFLKNGPAKTYNWAEPAKLKKAANFIKLVRRRYA